MRVPSTLCLLGGACTTLAAALSGSLPPRVVAVGDLHGDYKAAVRVLQLSGLIDKAERWVGGGTSLVQLGDFLDRGAEERECWALLDRLKIEAPRSGGQVVCLLGNHEILNACGLATPFVHADALGHFGDRQAAFAPGGSLAARLAECPVVAIVGDSAFVHAALPANATRESISVLNAEVREWLLGERPEGPPRSMLGGACSPVWDRTLSLPGDHVEPAGEACDQLRDSLGALGVTRCVVGHTPQMRVNAACGGAVWRCDTGMSRWVMAGECEALEITPAGEVRVLRALPGTWASSAVDSPSSASGTSGSPDSQAYLDYF